MDDLPPVNVIGWGKSDGLEICRFYKLMMKMAKRGVVILVVFFVTLGL